MRSKKFLTIRYILEVGAIIIYYVWFFTCRDKPLPSYPFVLLFAIRFFIILSICGKMDKPENYDENGQFIENTHEFEITKFIISGLLEGSRERDERDKRRQETREMAREFMHEADLYQYSDEYRRNHGTHKPQ